MKRITKLTGANFKGRDFTHELQAVNLIIGPNWTHKTARLDAAQLALAGFHPSVKRTNGDIFASFAGSNADLVAGVEFDNGFTVARRYAMKRESVTCNVELGGGFGGKEWACAAVLIDAGQYLGLTPRERIKYLFDMLDLTACKVTAEAMTADLKNIKLEKNTEYTETAIAEVCKIVAETWVVGNVQLSLESLVGTTRARKLDADRDAKRLTATVQGLTQMRADQKPVNINRAIDAELVEARRVLEAIHGEGAAINERVGATIAANKKARDEHRTACDEHTKAIAERDRMLHRNAARRVEIETILGSAVNRQPVIAEKRGQIATLQAGVAVKQQPDSKGLTAAEREHALAQQAILMNEGGLKKLLEEQHADAEDTTPCVCCQKTGVECAASRRRAEKFAGDIFAQQNRLQTATENEALKLAAVTALREANRLQSIANAEQDQLREKIAKLSNEVLELVKADELETCLRTELQTLDVPAVPDVAPLGDLPDTTAAEAELVTKREAYKTQKAVVDELEGVQRLIVQARAEKASQARAVAEAALAEARAEVLGAAVAVIEARQKQLVADAFGAVLEVANRLCAPLLRSPLAYHEGELGRFNGSRFIRHQTFSGTEKAVAYASLCLALGAESSIKLVVVDEMGRMDSANKSAFLEIVKGLVREGVIAQFIGVDVDAVDYNCTDVNVISTASAN